MNNVPIPSLTLYFQKYLFNALSCFTCTIQLANVGLVHFADRSGLLWKFKQIRYGPMISGTPLPGHRHFPDAPNQPSFPHPHGTRNDLSGKNYFPVLPPVKSGKIRNRNFHIRPLCFYVNNLIDTLAATIFIKDRFTNEMIRPDYNSIHR